MVLATRAAELKDFLGPEMRQPQPAIYIDLRVFGLDKEWSELTPAVFLKIQSENTP